LLFFFHFFVELPFIFRLPETSTQKMLSTLRYARAPLRAVQQSVMRNATVRRVEDVYPEKKKVTIGAYLAKRLVENGLGHYFTVPGDYTLSLLDEFLKEESLTMVGCCNELNAAYAADGYARATGGLGVVCVTYMYAEFEISSNFKFLSQL
jgi:hypothetical protein